MNKVLITGSEGFLGRYVTQEFLSYGYEVVGVDNYSKGNKKQNDIKVHRHDLTKEIFTNSDLVNDWMTSDYVINLASMIGGIRYFIKYAYDLLSHNEKLYSNVFDASIQALSYGKIKRMITISSSMVFENCNIYPSKESDVEKCPPPSSSYGFQKLSTQYFSKAAWEQYKLPYTILNLFNAVGLEHGYNNQDSHVLPELIYKTLILKQDPLKILGNGNQVRCYTHGKDLARGVRLALESEKAVNETFNLSNPKSTTVLELAEIIWKKVNPNKPFRYECEKPLKYDVQKRIPDVSKAKELLGFEAEISLEETVDEVIEWIKECEKQGR